jgi:hypothetical protein
LCITSRHILGATSYTDKNKSALIAIVISALLVTLNVIRIFHVSITYDEYIPKGYFSLFSYKEILLFKDVSSNNHLLSTFFRKFFTEAGGHSIFWVRAASLMAQLIYLRYAYAVCKYLFPEVIWQIGAFLLLNLHPFMFQFWGLGRGYSLAIAFMMASVYYILVFLRERSILSLNLALYSALLAVLGNFTLADYYCALLSVCILAVILPQRSKGNPLPAIISIAIALIAAMLLAAPPIKQLRDANQLYYGGNKDLLHDTIFSLIQADTNALPDSNFCYIISCLSIITTAIAGLYWVGKLKKTTGSLPSAGLSLWLLLIIPAFAMIVQHMMLGVLYPIDRVGMFLLPLYMLSMSYWLHYSTKPAVSISLLAVLIVCVVYNFACGFTSNSTRIWSFDVNDRDALEQISKETTGKSHKNKIAVTWFFKPSFDYYAEEEFFTQIESVTKLESGPVPAVFDYCYVTGDQPDSLLQGYEKDTSFSGGAFVLWRKHK